MTTSNNGTISQIFGPVVDVRFPAGFLPPIYNAVTVTDASRDIEAGLRAGTATIAAAYGYITEDDDPREWGADIIAIDTQELTQIVLKAVNLES